MTHGKESIRIYVACLAAYNNGILHGEWIDADQDPYDIWQAVIQMLANSPIPDAEEWAIHDHDGFEGLQIGEHESFETVSIKAAFIEAHGKLGAELATYYGGDIEEAKRALDDHYAGAYQSLADFAEEITDISDVPEHLRFYIDFDAMGRDLAISDVIAIDLGQQNIHVFWSH